MTCAFCDAPIASSLLDRSEPEAEFLCVKHLARLLRFRAKPRCAKPDCNREILLKHCAATDTPRTICAFCALGRPVSVDVSTSVLPVPIRRGKDE